jgi:hypothetical protein
MFFKKIGFFIIIAAFTYRGGFQIHRADRPVFAAPAAVHHKQRQQSMPNLLA